MGGWRRNQSRKGGPQWTPSYFPKEEVMDIFRPGKTKAIWIPSIPSWEKEFCKQSVSLPWKEFCEVKKCTIFFPEIEKWNDSAAEEAFHVAKRRYFSKINGTRCDIPEVDPNAYIDEVDWKSLDLGDIDWPEGRGSDSETEENCAKIESLPDLYQDMTTSEKERYEKNKSQWKERPFGYGHIYFPEILESRTVICKVVDLYTAQPRIINHWKVDLWSESFRMPMPCAANNEFGVSGWGSEFEHEKEEMCLSTDLPLVCNSNQKKKWRKKTQNKENTDQKRDQNDMNANKNCRTEPKKCKNGDLQTPYNLLKMR